MAVNAFFSADFGSFFTAVEQSEAKLKTLETGAAKVEGSLSRMANSFSGQKVIQDATLMAKVFEDAGGAAAFTEKEMQRMGATAREAVEKLTALGQDVPPGIRKIAEETKGAAKETEGWSASLKTMVLGFVSLQTAKAAWNFVADIAATAGALADLSDQTQIGVEDLQRMGNAMSDFGVSTDEMGRALFKLSKNIAGGSDSVSDALLTMGLSLEEVQNMRGEELFLTIMDGLAKLQGGLRDTVAVDLFGEKLGAAMAGASTGIRGVMADQEKMNAIWSEDTVRALDESTEAIEKMKRSLVGIAANALGPVAEGFNTLVAAFNKGADAWAIAKAMAGDMWEEWGKGTPVVSRLTAELDRLNQQHAVNAPATKASAAAGNEHAAALSNQAGETKRLREEEERLQKQRFNPAETLSGFEEATKVAAKKQEIIDEEIKKTNELRDVEQAAHNSRMAAGAAWMAAAGDVAKVNKANADATKNLATEQTKLDAENQALIASWQGAGAAAEEAGTKGAEGGAATAQAWVGVQQQIEVTADAVRGWLELMRYTNAANALLNQNSLFTTGSTLENQSRLGGAFSPIPGFASGVTNFSGGLAKVHAGETLVNLPSGTSVIPAGAGGVNVTNTFNIVDTEANLARRVSDTIMRTVRAGTQLGTA